MVLTQPNVRTQMTKSKIQMNQASGFRRSARLGVELALNVLPLDIVLCGSAALTITVDAVIYVHVALSAALNIHTCSGMRFAVLLLAATLAVASAAISGRTVARALRRLARGCLKPTLLSDWQEAWLGGCLVSYQAASRRTATRGLQESLCKRRRHSHRRG